MRSDGRTEGTSTSRANSARQTRIDSILEAPIKAGKVAGASVAVIQGHDTIALKSYGLADLQLDVPMPPNAIFEIGSVTKQFTAAAVLQLVEQGKLSLDDDLTKFFPNYPTKGHRITVRRLLNHTSGIKSYTGMPEFWRINNQTLPRDTVVTLVSRQPFDFVPGEQEQYNNSAFFLLGLIIEKVTGKSYGTLVEQNLFAKAGMKDSYYCSERAIHRRQVHGYDTDSTGLVQKAYSNHTWPYAAGSLCSTAADLAAWNRALHGGAIIGPEMYREMTTPAVLNDGTKLRYGMGIAISETLGRRVLHHDGGIFGFRSANRYYPDDSLTVVVLFNTMGPVDPNDAAAAIAEAVLGKTDDEGRPFNGDLSELAGVYKGPGPGSPMELTIAVAGDQLTMKSPFANSARTLTYLGDDTFGRGETRLTFRRNGARASGVRFDIVYASTYLVRQ